MCGGRVLGAGKNAVGSLEECVPDKRGLHGLIAVHYEVPRHPEVDIVCV